MKDDAPIANELPPSCYPELIAVLVAGTLHVVIEVMVSQTIARIYNAAVALAFLAYLIWRVKCDRQVLRAWGMRTDNLRPATRAFAAFGIPAAILIYAFGWWKGTAPLPRTFWLIFLLYPVWGIAQQFALQNLVGNNLRRLVKSPVLHALVTTTLFSASHFPKYALMSLTFVAGFAFTLLYRRHPNLWAVGIAHGFLGALAYYLVLGLDPVVGFKEFLAAHGH